MKTLKFKIILCTLCIVLISCKDAKRKVAKQNVADYSNYVDSISKLDFAEANTSWENIEKGYNRNKTIANENLIGIKENDDFKKDIDVATQKFEDFKEEIAESKRQEIKTQKNNFRISLLGINHENDDMMFEWINKANILTVYQNFVDTVEANKDSYTREDWDEIKLLYEAIDTRKNTVENEGLTNADNLKIAGLKLKFAPMYTFNRMGAKSEENVKAKQ